MDEDEDEDVELELGAEETPPTRRAREDDKSAAEAFTRLQKSTGGKAVSLSRRLQASP